MKGNNYVYVSKLDQARDEVLEEYLTWALETFPDETLIEQAIHLLKETKELDAVEADPLKDRRRLMEERADVAFIAVLIACRIIERCEQEGLGWNLVEALKDKLEINKTRRWERTPDGDYQHIRTKINRWGDEVYLRSDGTCSDCGELPESCSPDDHK